VLAIAVAIDALAHDEQLHGCDTLLARSFG